MTNTAREFALYCACARWPDGLARKAAIRAAARDVDWNVVVALQNRHRISGLMNQGLRAAGVVLPPEAEAAIAGHAQRVGRMTLGYAAEAVRLTGLFAAAGVPVAFVKGVALGKLAYGEIGLKHTRDNDMLIDPAHRAAALAALQADGYVLEDPRLPRTPVQSGHYYRRIKDHSLRHRERGLVVELHWRLFPNPTLGPGLTAAAATHAVEVAPGRSLNTLEPDALVVYLAAHGTNHGWSRLKWLADVGALLAGYDAQGFERLRGLAARERLGPCLDSTLLVCRRLLGLTLPEDILVACRRNPAARALAAIGVANLAAGGQAESLGRGPAGEWRSLPGRFLMGPGLGHVVSEVRLHAVGVNDVLDLPLPRGLGWLYAILRAPMWIARRLGERLKPV